MKGEKRYLRKSNLLEKEFSGKTFDEYMGSVMVEAIPTLILYYVFCFPELLIYIFGVCLDIGRTS